MSDVTDSSETTNLLRAFAHRDSAALQERLELHRPYLRRVVQMRIDTALAARVDPSDIDQEAHVVIFKRIGPTFARLHKLMRTIG